MKLSSSILFVAFSLSVFTQEFTITGRVIDENNKPLSYVNIIVENSEDNSFVKGTSTNDNGQFEIDGLSSGKFILKVSFIGCKTVELPLNLSENKVLKDIILIEDSEDLDQITVTARRPIIDRKPDRLTFTIENTALTEGSTLQVLKSTPGVIISEGKIKVKSDQAIVYINNRRLQLTSEELIQFLESAPANSIKSIDVITNPPAIYDADSGSVINIISSKNLIAGYRGSIATNYTQGVFPRYNAATSHYFKNDKISLNLSYNYINKKINRAENNGIDYLDTNGNLDQIWNSDINRNTSSETHNARLNFDFSASENTTLSLNSTALFTPYFNYRIANNTLINDADSNFIDSFLANNLSRDDKYNIGTTITLKTNFKNNSSLLIDGHYTTYDYKRNQFVNQTFQIDNSQDSEFRTIANQDTNIYTAKTDYSLPISDNSSFDAGAKFSNINTKSDITRLDIVNGNETLNMANSNAFDYDENVIAFYSNYSKSWDTWSVVLGLRAEQTNVEGVSPTLNQTNTQDYFEWFPNTSVSYNPSNKFSLYGNYKRSITRPSYTDLNPFTFFLNENTTVEGNPTLQPTFVDHFVVGSTFLEHFTIEAYYINYDGDISEIPRQDNINNILTYTPVNLDKKIDFGFDFIVDFNPTEIWYLYFVTSFYNINEETNFGSDRTELDQWANFSSLSNNFSLLKDNSLNVNFNLTYVGKNLQGLQIVDTRFISNLSITKRILNKKGILSLSIEDLFNEQDFVSNVRYLNQSNRQFINLDNRFVKLGFRYKFGNTKLSTNERATSVEERDRLKDLN